MQGPRSKPDAQEGNLFEWREERLTEVEAAAFVRFKPQSLAKRRFRGLPPLFERAGKRILYRRGDLLQWLEGSKFRSTTEAKAALGRDRG